MRLVESQKLYPHKDRAKGILRRFLKRYASRRKRARPFRFFPPALLRPRVSWESEKTYREFERQALKTPVGGVLHEAGGMLYALPEGVFDWKELHVLRAGIRLGEVKNGRFEPSHSLAMCLKKDSFKSALNLSGFRRKDGKIPARGNGDARRGKAGKGLVRRVRGRLPYRLGKSGGGYRKKPYPQRSAQIFLNRAAYPILIRQGRKREIEIGGETEKETGKDRRPS